MDSEFVFTVSAKKKTDEKKGIFVEEKVPNKLSL